MGWFSPFTVIACYLLVSFSQRYESDGTPFNTGAGGGTADYAFCLLLGASSMLLSYPALGPALGLYPILAPNLVYYVLYVWSKRNPTANASLWGIPVPGRVLPFAYLGFVVVTGGGPMPLLHGYLFGHLYYFLADVVPQVRGRDVISTPQFLIDRLGVGERRPEHVRVAPPPSQARATLTTTTTTRARLSHGGVVTPGASGLGGGGGASFASRSVGGGGASSHHWGGGGQKLGARAAAR
jgi:Derlin-2/3